MNLSIEAKVAAAIAAGFIVVTAGAIGQERSGEQGGGPNNYGPMNNSGVNAHMSQQGYNSSLPGRTNAEENRQKFSDENATYTAPNKRMKAKSGKSSKHHTRHNEGMHNNGPGERH